MRESMRCLTTPKRPTAAMADGRIADDQDSFSPGAGIPTMVFIFFGRGAFEGLTR